MGCDLVDGVTDARASEAFEAWLDVQSRFHDYSHRNTLFVLVFMDPGLIAPLYLVAGTIAVAIMELTAIEAIGPVPMTVIVSTVWAPVVGGAIRWWKRLGDSR